MEWIGDKLWKLISIYSSTTIGDGIDSNHMILQVEIYTTVINNSRNSKTKNIKVEKNMRITKKKFTM